MKWAWALLLGLAALVRADRDLLPVEYCVSACMAPVYYMKFPDVFKFCVSPKERDSLLLCAQNYCTPAEFDAGLAYTNASCEEHYGGPWPSRDEIDDIVNSYSSAQFDAFQVIDYPLPKRVINGTFRFSPHLFDVAYTTVQQAGDVRNLHLQYSYAQFIFWGIVIGLGVAVNGLNWMRSLSWDLTTRRTPEQQRGPITSAGLPRRIWTQVRAHFLLPALWRKRASEPVLWRQGTLAPRAESFVIISMIVVNVVLCAVNIPATPENIYYPQVSLQTWRYFADRTGYLSYANLSIFWLFAIRNNVLLWLTGWEFNTFNRFHRWVARVSTLQAVLHSIAYTAYEFIEGKLYYDKAWAQEYWYTGGIATVAMALIIGVSVRAMRVRAYEAFLLLHIALSLTVLVNLFYHTKIFKGQYDGFLWPCVAFWALDRALRIARLAYTAARAASLRSHVEHSAADDVVRIDATPALAARNVAGGSHWFLYSPRSLRFWESHPFTLARWKSTITACPSPDDSPPSSPGAESEKNGVDVDVALAAPNADDAVATTHYSFILRPRKGYTGRLARAVSGGARALPLLFEGAYGHGPDLRGFSDVLLIIGGSGISAGISAIYSALERNPQTQLRLVWASRTAGLIDGIMARELRAAAASRRLRVDAFVTGSPAAALAARNYRSAQSGRPDVGGAIGAAVRARRGALAVVVCGPGSMMDDARAAFCGEVGRGAADVQLFLESFEW